MTAHNVGGLGRRWYGGHMPPYHQKIRFARFVGTSTVLARYAAQPKKVRKITFVKEPFPQPDLDEHIIRLPAAAMGLKYYLDILGLESEEALGDAESLVVGVLNGLTVHQATRIRLNVTRGNAARLPLLNGSADGVAWAALPIFWDALGLVSDFYADGLAGRASYGGFVREMVAVLFNPYLLDQALVASPQNYQELMLLLAFYRNPALHGHPLWQDPFVACCCAVLDQAHSADTFAKRAELAKQLVELFLNAEGQPDPSQGQEEGQGQGQQGGSSGSEDEDDQGEDSEDGEDDEDRYEEHGHTCPHCGGASDMLDKLANADPDGYNVRSELMYAYEGEGSIDAELDLERMARQAEVGAEVALRQIAHHQRDDDTLHLMDIAALDLHHDKHLVPPPEFANFAQLLEQMRSKLLMNGRPTDVGSKIVGPRLHRIATDHKIFGPPRSERLNKEREIVFLVDFSGSMDSNDLLGRALAATLGAFGSLTTRGQTRMAAYGFTSRRAYHIASWGMGGVRNLDFEDRFNQAHYVSTGDTPTGQAIRFASGLFSDRTRAERMLLVLTDGAPTETSSDGQSPDEYARSQTMLLRQRGVAVVSLALIQGVVRANQAIFGREYTVDASNGRLPSEMARVLAGLFA